jgi:hypothetical protein
MRGVLFQKRYWGTGDEKYVETNCRINEFVDRNKEPEESGGEWSEKYLVLIEKKYYPKKQELMFLLFRPFSVTFFLFSYIVFI